VNRDILASIVGVRTVRGNHKVVADDGRQQRKPDFRTAVEDVKALATVLAMEAESVLGKRTARFLGVLVLLAVSVGVLLALLDWYIAPTDAKQKQALVLTLAQILGGTVLLSGLYFTWRTLLVNREGQITERFTRAIDLLGATDDKGDKRIEIRLGGIYALERIAKDSPERDYSTIMEVLAAYLRKNAPRPPEESWSFESWVFNSEPIDKNKIVTDITKHGEPPEPPVDVRAIITILRRRKKAGEKDDVVLDLRETDLRKANLIRANLRGANLEGANLIQANLEQANLQRAFLDKANLQGASLRTTYLHGALLRKASLQRAYFAGANLQGADLREANLQEADLREHEVFIYVEGLAKPHNFRADLQLAHLGEANLQGAVLDEANLQGAFLEGANLQAALLRGANLQGADLQGADLRYAEVTNEQLANTLSLQGATMPNGSKHP
jgi:uncharacterized protein YjbI with pentapeptide repeats